MGASQSACKFLDALSKCPPVYPPGPKYGTPPFRGTLEDLDDRGALYAVQYLGDRLDRVTLAAEHTQICYDAFVEDEKKRLKPSSQPSHEDFERRAAFDQKAEQLIRQQQEATAEMSDAVGSADNWCLARKKKIGDDYFLEPKNREPCLIFGLVWRRHIEIVKHGVKLHKKLDQLALDGVSRDRDEPPSELENVPGKPGLFELGKQLRAKPQFWGNRQA